MRKIAFFNIKGGIGNTTTVYNLAWMFSEMGIKTIAVDFDPQSDLTTMFLRDSRLEKIYSNSHPHTLLDTITPIVNGDPAISVPSEEINENLRLIPGHLALSTFEDLLSEAWLKCLNSEEYSFRISSIFKTIIDHVAKDFGAEVVLMDVGPNLGSINRAVNISSDFIVMPVSSDLFSSQALKNLGITLNKWKVQWQQRRNLKPSNLNNSIPENRSKPLGYIVIQHSAKEINSVKSNLNRDNKIPVVYSEFVLNEAPGSNISTEKDENCLGLLKQFKSLDPMSKEAKKPIFLLKPADGAIGAHAYAVRKSYREYEVLAKRILSSCRC